MKQSDKKRIVVSLFLVLALAIPFASMSLMFARAQADPTYIIPLDDWIKNDDIAAIKLVNQLLEENVTVMWAQESFLAGGTTYPAGTMYIETPFTTRHGVSSDVMMEWFMWEAKMNRVLRIDTTVATFTANAVPLIQPRIVMYFDKYTYDNCLNNYNRLKSLGFKVELATAMSMVGTWWNDSANPLSRANVFLMPGGAVHLWQFPYTQEGTWAIQNISEFVFQGGGYFGPCAGASEALNKTPYLALKMVDADYERDWFDAALSPPGQGATEYKALIGPMYITVDMPDHPVMFGYGPNASRPGYGPEVPIYYYGGPSYVNLSSGIDVLGCYSRPISQNLEAAGRTNSIWGKPAILAANYGSGRLVLFGPHPEWPGPGARLYAQAAFWTAQNRIDASRLDPSSTSYNPAEILSSRVSNILSTAAEIAPYLESITRIATDIVNLRAGDAYNPVGYSYDEVLMYYAMTLTDHLNYLKADAIKFRYEYYKLSLLRDSVSPTTRNTIDYAMALIDSFFNYSEAFPYEPHVFENSTWAGDVFAPYIGDANSFTDGLTELFIYILNETQTLHYPRALNYTEYYNIYNELFVLNKTAPSSIPTNATLERWGFNVTLYAGSNVTTLLIDYHASIPLYPMYALFNHPLDIAQFKIDTHLLNMMTIGDRVREVCSYLSFAIASEVGAWAYALAEWQATIYEPGGPFV